RAWRAERPTEALPDRPTQSDHGPDYDAVELRQELIRALGGLTQRQRATVVLRFYFDLSEAETAETLGCSVGTVKSQTARALRRLRDGPVLSSIREGTNH